MPQPFVSPYLLPILLLIASNVFMTFAWYGHLRFKAVPLAAVIVVSWGIAFVEYCFAVPANRWGSEVYSAAQLKTLQEIITLIAFAGFSIFYLHQSLTWNHVLASVSSRSDRFSFSMHRCRRRRRIASPRDVGRGCRSMIAEQRTCGCRIIDGQAAIGSLTSNLVF